MNHKVYSIRDAKTEVFNLPFYKPTHGAAERDFKTLVNESKDQSMIARHPEDYDLYYVGEYDDNTGKLDPVDTPQHIIKAVQCVKNDPRSVAETAPLREA